MKQKLFFNYTLLFCFLGIQAQTKIGNDILGSGPWELSGRSVSISADGTTVAIGASNNSSTGNLAGHGRVFKYEFGSWNKIGSDVAGSNQDLLGFATSISGDGRVVAFGAPFADSSIYPDTGGVKIYENISGNWIQIGDEIYGLNMQESLGYSVSLSNDGSIVAIGAPYSSIYKKEAGLVRIYQNISGNWVQIGNDIGQIDDVTVTDTESATYNHFGSSVSISSDGSIVAIGAPKDDGKYVYSGKAFIYKNVAGVWTQVGNTISGEYLEKQLGRSVALSADGTVLAVTSASGRLRMYNYLNGGWTLIGTKIEGEYGASGKIGPVVSISADGSIVAIGSPNDSKNGTNSGQTRIYKNISGNWNKLASIQGDFASDFSGNSVSLSSNGLNVAIGALDNDQNGELSGKTTVYDLSTVLTSSQFMMERTTIYPNPVKNQLNIQLKDDLNLQQVNIYSILGQLIRTEKTNQIDVSSLTSGFYFVQIITDKGIATQKVLVE